MSYPYPMYEICSEILYQIYVRNFCKKFLYDIFLRNICTIILVRNLCTKFVYEIVVENCCTQCLHEIFMTKFICTSNLPAIFAPKIKSLAENRNKKWSRLIDKKKKFDKKVEMTFLKTKVVTIIGRPFSHHLLDLEDLFVWLFYIWALDTVFSQKCWPKMTKLWFFFAKLTKIGKKFLNEKFDQKMKILAKKQKFWPKNKNFGQKTKIMT